jgi:dihydroorotase
MNTRIVNAKIVNEGKVVEGDVLIHGQRIEKIGKHLTDPAERVIDAAGKFLFPGFIDDQVHFREPGLTHKGTIFTESRAAVVWLLSERKDTNPGVWIASCAVAPVVRVIQVLPNSMFHWKTT